MATIDPEEERRRLAEFYAGQTDDELEQVAAQAHELTELAREALRAELSRRGLYAGQLNEPDSRPVEDSPEFRELVTIRSFWNLAEAQLAKGLLDASGIESFLFDDNMVRLDWFNANALGGVKLRVDTSNVNAANEVLEQSTSNDRHFPGDLAEEDQTDPGLPEPGSSEPGSQA